MVKKAEKAVEANAVKTAVAENAAKPTEAKIDAKANEVKTKADKPAVKAENKNAKIAAKPLVKESTKTVKAEDVKKPAEKAAKQVKSEPVKKVAAAVVEKTAEVKAEKAVKGAEVKSKETKSVKAEVKSDDKAIAKSGKATDKQAAKKAKETKTTVKKEPKKTEKAPVKKAVKKIVKKIDQEKLDQYAVRSLADCIQDMQKMQVQYEYEDYYRLLLDEADLKKLAKNIIEGNNIKNGNYDYKELGYDIDLVMVTLDKVAETMDIKAADFKEYKKSITKALNFTMGEDAEANAGEYLDEFKLAEKLLMVGQRKEITEAEALSALIGADVNAYFKHFFTFAYALLPSWQYDDVKYYENFAYAVLSQFSDLYESEQQRIQIDVADLYIKHGDYQLGDELYGYILRDNQIKDYIYYRYASVYKDIDYNKAKSIAYSSFQYVDDRYTYYPNILEIVNQ
ncbi:neurofilament protein [bacterium c-19]|nr:neurofilament protein [bacterium c-19]